MSQTTKKATQSALIDRKVCSYSFDNEQYIVRLDDNGDIKIFKSNPCGSIALTIDPAEFWQLVSGYAMIRGNVERTHTSCD